MPILQGYDKDVWAGVGTIQHVRREPSYYRARQMNGISDNSKQKKSEVIPMYDELIKRLREAPNDWYDADLHYEAADAIEDLSREAEVNAKRARKWAFDAEEAEAKLRWIPVTERLPREQETVLIWGKQGVILLDWRRDNKWSCFRDVTHWMPLPEPPKDGEQ